MTRELLAPAGMTLERAAAAIGGLLTVSVRPGGSRDRLFYDTFDGLVREAGLAAVHDDGALALIECGGGGVRLASEMRRPLEPLLCAELPDCALKQELVAIAGVRALLPLVGIESRERVLDVLDDERKTVVRMALTAPVAVAATGVASRGGNLPALALRLRLTLSAVRGYGAELQRARSSLIEELGFVPAQIPLVDEAVLACGGLPGGVPSKVSVALSHGERAGQAVVAVLRRLLEVIVANLDGTLDDVDSEFLHDLRVSVRRSRAVQREMRDVFDPESLAYYRAELRWLQQATGPMRDLDVHVLEFDDYRALLAPELRDDLDPLLEILKERRKRALAAMRRDLRSQRAQALFGEWETYLAKLRRAPVRDRPGAMLAIEQLAGERILKLYRRIVKMGAALTPDSPPEELHEVRKQGKELRYLLELFGEPLFPAETVKPLVKSLKSIQDVLGRHQDRAVQVTMLRGLQAELAPRPAGVAALVATGALLERMLEDERLAHAEFIDRFSAFAGRAQRKRVRATFS